MPRAYSTSIVSHALIVTPKWLDNVLTNHQVPGVARQRQGIERELTPDSIARLYVAKTLVEQLRCPVANALVTANTILNDGVARLCPGVQITCDPNALREALDARLLDAVEAAPRKKRGRPPKRRNPYLAVLPEITGHPHQTGRAP